MNLHIRKLALASLFAAGAAVAPQAYSANVDIEVGVAPPAARYEVAPAPRQGYVWRQGYWGWDGHRHVWHNGHWERARPGYAYRSPHWVEHNGRWSYQASRWDR